MSEKDFEREVIEWLNSSSDIKPHVLHVESPVTSPGIPDLDVAMVRNGVQYEFHLEVKYSPWKQAPEIRPTQIKWFRDRIRNGGNCAVVWKEGPDTIHLIEGYEIPNLKSNQSKSWLGHVWSSHGLLGRPAVESLLGLFK